MPRSVLLLAVLALPPTIQEPATTRGFELRAGDRICLVGNALAERMQHHGWLEARLQSRLPDHGLSVRNLGFSADELTVYQRTAGFGSRDEYLARCRAGVVFAFFGFVESFAGPAGLAKFRGDLEAFVDHTLAQEYDGEGAPRLVLFSPIPFEDLGDASLPDAAKENARIAPYGGAIAAVAQAKGVPFVDLFEPVQALYAELAEPLTIDGIHLNERGGEALARVIEAALLGAGPTPEPDVEALAAVRALVLEKNLVWFNRYRATDGYNVYGGRSSLAYSEGPTGPKTFSNFDVLQREMEVLDATANNLDLAIHAIARGTDPASVSVSPADIPPLLPVPTNFPGDGPGGAHRFLGGEEALGRMTVAEGMRVGLFASEKQFPELVNPVQMAWDARGRLWVAVWPTYPHWTPGEAMDDKLLILEDTGGDGRADSCRTFAADLHNPTGFEFWNGGVLVASCPDLLFLEDTDGDDVVDRRERVLGALSSADTHHSANSFVLGPDGALYFQEGTFHQSQVESIHGPVRNRDGCVWRFEPRTRRVERYVPYGFANPHGHVFDRWGQDFVTDGTGNVNYYALPFSGHLAAPRSHSEYFPFFEQRSRPCAGTEILSSRHFPEASQGNYLVANVIGFRGIFQYRVEEDGAGFAGVEVEPIVHSADPNFRPSDIEVGPDGALYFLDWHNPIIGHMQHHLRDPSRDVEHGRVYRVTWPGRELLEPVPIAGQPVEELLELLKSPEDRVRYRARIELSARNSDEVVVAAREWAARLDEFDDEYEHHLLEALWLQEQHDTLDDELLDVLLHAADHRARAAGTRVLRHMRRDVERPVELLRTLVRDEHPRVRLEALVALSFLGHEPRATETSLLALERDMDRFLDYALEETLTALEPAWLAQLGEAWLARAPRAGVARLLRRLDSAELAAVAPSAALFEEMLGRHGLAADEYVRAARELAAMRPEASTAAGELLAAIARADMESGPHTDHLLQGLLEASASLSEGRAELASAMRALAAEGKRASTRRLAVAARIEAEGSLEAAWREATRSVGALGELLDAAAYVDEPAIVDGLFTRAMGLVDGLPPELAAEVGEGGLVRGRYVRVELPGERRTLTLAEVEVHSGGENVAPRGSATQSSVAWGGVAEHALDGNRSGRYADGGQTHTVEDQPDPFWELDLGVERAIDRIVLWNRSESGGQFASRLDGFVVRILDGERSTVFRQRAGSAAHGEIVLEIVDPALHVRRAAVLALASLGVRRSEAVAALAARFDDPDLEDVVVEALRGIALDEWPAETRASIGALLLARFEAGTPAEYEGPAARELLALADELAPHLDGPSGARLRDARRRLGPQVVVLRPVVDALTYDRDELTVVAGHPVELVFDNVDIMPHNLVVAAPGALARVGRAGDALSSAPDGWAKGFVPAIPEVLHATRLVQPGESQTLRFEAPATPGDYPYVCTFPGHWVRMNGVMHVVRSWDDVRLEADAGRAAAPAAAARSFVRAWTFEDLRPHLAAVGLRSPERGREVFDAASCLRCHAVGGEGGTTGPELSEVVGRYRLEELLRHVVDPSGSILEGYESEIFLLTDGRVVAGLVKGEDGGVVRVQVDPYADDAVELALEDVEERGVSKISTMPGGLLSTFERGEILDLLAYLESLRGIGGD